MANVPGWTSWSLSPLLWIGVVAAGTWYVMMLRRVRRLTGRRVGIGHWGFYFSGLGVIVLALGSPVNTIAVHWLLSVHMLQHTLLSDIAPPLVILGLRAPVLPLGMPRAALKLVAHRGALGRFWGFATRPWVAIPLWCATLIFWSIPAVFEFATRHQLVHNVEHFTLFYTGYALWWLIITPLPSERRAPGFARLGYLGVSRLASAFICLPLAFMTKTIYPLYVSYPRGFGISAATDQHIAGGAMCLVEFVVFGVAAALVFIDALNREEKAQALTELRLTAQS
ncbi:MAG TPA: cytochrome c oxidase assembly protein [Solirubrobacteraceae bacterium]|nr:cytochrome c oxidase assembly protein [Solirubrobacteraceae bacterium]